MVRGMVAKVDRELNASAWEEAGVDGQVVHEAWLARTEPGGAEQLRALLAQVGGSAVPRLKLLHRLRAISRDAMAPNPPPPPPPNPNPPPVAAA